MMMLPSSVRLYLAAKPTDMRNGFDGLAAEVRRFGLDPLSGHLFVFLSRRADRAKLLWFERGGLVIWSKRLEQGRFRLPKTLPPGAAVSIDPGQLAMLLDGVDFAGVRRSIRWQPVAPAF